jgi:hypothetical protein
VGRAERFRKWLLEWLALAAVFAAGGLITWGEHTLGLLGWAHETLSAAGALLMLAAGQGALVAVAAAWRWRARTRLVLGAILACSLVLTVAELRAGWLDWALPDRDEDVHTRSEGIGILLPLLLNAIPPALAAGIAWAVWPSSED